MLTLKVSLLVPGERQDRIEKLIMCMFSKSDFFEFQVILYEY